MKTALKTIELISAINKIPFDTKAAINRFALTEIEPSIEEVVRILKNSEFKAKIKQLNEKSLLNYEAPFIALKKDSSYFAILKILKEDKKVIIYDGGSSVKELNFNELFEILYNKAG